MSIPTVIELFSGAGGFSLGFQAAGCKINAAVDIDETAACTFERNFKILQPDSPPYILTGDEGNLEDVELELLTPESTPDILIGGPPCQGFSRIGRAKLDSLSEEGFAGDPRNNLYIRFLEAAELWRPLAVVMENVPGMLSVSGRNLADEAGADLASRGYRVGYAILNSVWYGVPQFRERLFLIGFRNDLEVTPSMPAASHKSSLPAGYLQPKVMTLPLPFMEHYELSVDVEHATTPATSVSDALEDLAGITAHLDGSKLSYRGDFRQEIPYRSPPASEYAQLMRAWPGFPVSNCVLDHVSRRTPRDYETFRRMKPGDRYPEALKLARQRFNEELIRLGDSAPDIDTVEYRELSRKFIPPYPEEIFFDKWRKLIPDQPSWTIPAHLSKDAYSHIHYDSAQARAISIREAARLQSFPDAFQFSGNMGDCYRQIGNAVPPLLAWAIAYSVLVNLGYEGAAPQGLINPNRSQNE
jgi:DNA (cytosine-5)-methyltransferase 1